MRCRGNCCDLELMDRREVVLAAGQPSKVRPLMVLRYCRRSTLDSISSAQLDPEYLLGKAKAILQPAQAAVVGHRAAVLKLAYNDSRRNSLLISKSHDSGRAKDASSNELD